MKTLLLGRTDQVGPVSTVIAVAIGGRGLVLRLAAAFSTTVQAENEQEGTEADEEAELSQRPLVEHVAEDLDLKKSSEF